MLIDWPFPKASDFHPMPSHFNYERRMRAITARALQHYQSL